MSNEVVCVYQDCPMCGSKGNELKKILISENLQLRKVSFASDEGRDLIQEALAKHQIGTLPFYVKDGRFSNDVSKVLEPEEKPEEKPVEKPVEKPAKKPAKRVRKTKKVKEANGLDH